MTVLAPLADRTFTGQWYDHIWLGAVMLHVLLAALALHDLTRRSKATRWSWSSLLIGLWVVLVPIAGPGSYLVLRRQVRSHPTGRART